MTTTLPSLTRISAKLPSGYRKTASFEIAIPPSLASGGRGRGIEVAKFESSTAGQIDVFFKRTEDRITEIAGSEYEAWVIRSVGGIVSIPAKQVPALISMLQQGYDLATERRFPAVMDTMREGQGWLRKAADRQKELDAYL